MNSIEAIAALLGLLCVALVIRRSVWNFPVGIAMVVLYVWVFFQARLYSDALLQIVYVGMQVYGWWAWVRAPKLLDARIEITRLDPAGRAVTGAMVMAGSVALGATMATWTDAAMPYWDATTTILSLAAQWLLCRRKLDSWVLWIAVDLLSIGLYLNRELYPTAALYVLFLGMAIAGLLTWQRAERAALAPA